MRLLNQEDALAWDSALVESPNPSLLQSWRWGDLQARHGWQVERLRVAREVGSVPVSLLLARALPGRRFGYVARGPAVGSAELPAVLSALETAAREMRLVFLRVEPEAEGGVAMPGGWVRARPQQPENTSIIDLQPPAELILASFKPKTRYNVRLAEKHGVAVERSLDVATFARLSHQTASRHGISLGVEAYHRDLLEVLGDDATLYLARGEGQVLAGILVARFGRRAVYLHGASSEQGRKLMPAYLLQWRAMLDARDAGCTEYDLWGIPPDDRPGHPLANLWQFKSGWNGRMVHYAGAYDLPLDRVAWRAHVALSRIRGAARRVRSRLNHDADGS